MDNKIIDIEATVIPDPTQEEKSLKLIDELNNKISDNSGEWKYINGHGICWCPSLAEIQMGHPVTPVVPSPATPPSLLGEIVQWGNTIDFDNIPQNAVVLIKLDVSDPFRVQMMQKVIAKQVLEPRIEKLKEKHTCILFMQSGDDISVMTEAEMNKAGWIKTGLIIPPN